MGTRLRGDRPRHRDRPARAAHARRERRPTFRSGRWSARRRFTSGRGGAPRPNPTSIPPSLPARHPLDCLKQLDRLLRTSPRSAGSGSSTTTWCRATRSSGRAATPRSSAVARPSKALALATDCTPRYCRADPVRGGTQAVAESWRNLTAVGALPLGADRQHEFRQPGEAGDHGRVCRRRRRHARGLHGARLPGRLRQRVALQRDERQRDPADPGHRRRRVDRRCGTMRSISR